MNGVNLVEHAFMQAQVLAEAMGVCIDDVRWQDFTPAEIARLKELARERIRKHINGETS
jgi:predicted transcriptional regulator